MPTEFKESPLGMTSKRKLKLTLFLGVCRGGKRFVVEHSLPTSPISRNYGWRKKCPQNLHTNNSVRHKNSSSAFVGKFGGIVSFFKTVISRRVKAKGIKTIGQEKKRGGGEIQNIRAIFFFSLLYKLGIYSSGCCWVNRGDAKIVACLSGCKSTSCATDLHFLLKQFSRSFSTLTGETSWEKQQKKKTRARRIKVSGSGETNKLQNHRFFKPLAQFSSNP